MTKLAYKNYIKNKVRDASFQQLCSMQTKSAKFHNIKYHNMLKPQDYLTSSMFSNSECSLLFNLRATCVNGIREHFSHMFNGMTLCPLKCGDSDNLNTLLVCPKLTTTTTILKYDDVFGNTEQQLLVTKEYMRLLSIREELLEI